MARTLKVYRTPIGFHDAYVAASSQKAALAAWGSDANLFARGIAEDVSDAALTAEPLAHPGEVIRVARGSAEDHLAALPSAGAQKRAPERRDPPSKRRAPRPSKAALDAATAALDEATDAYAARDAALAKREAAIAAERRDLDRRKASELRKLADARDEAKADYDAKLADWEP